MSRSTPKLTLMDRMIYAIDPIRGARRYAARMQFAALEKYTGASKKKRSLSEWRTLSGSANADIPDLEELRERSIDLVRNVPIATGAVATITQRAIGTGLAFRSEPDFELLGISEDQAATWSEKTTAEFMRWAESDEADASRMGDFYAVQALAYRSSKVSGDAFALLPMIDDTRRMYSLAVLLIEADRVMNPKGQRDTERFAGGIETDAHGAPVRVHIAREHPGALGKIGRQIETDAITVFGEQTGRRNVLHVIDMLRPGQTRGVPWLAPIIEPIKQLGRYTEAEIDAAVTAAFFAVFVKSGDGLGLNPMESAVASDGANKDRSGPWDGRLSSGLVVDLRPGESIESAIANRPNQAFDGFVMAIFRQIAIGLSLPVEVLIKHFQSSYSAAKAALLDLWIYVTSERARFVSQFCHPISTALISEGVARGRIAAPGFFGDPRIRAAWCRGSWVGDGPGSLDPLKETQAAVARIDANLSTLAAECMQIDGSSWRDTMRQRGRERKFMREQGVEPVTAKPTAPTPAREDDEGDDRVEQ